MSKIKSHVIWSFLIVCVLFLTTCSASSAYPLMSPVDVSMKVANAEVPSVEVAKDTPEYSPSEQIETSTEITPTIYLPMINRVLSSGKFFGIYLDQYWTDKSVADRMTSFDVAVGKKHTAVGWFINLEDSAFTIPVYYLPDNNLYSQLEALWKAGYTSFINLGTDANAEQILSGERDMEIGYAAQFYKAWVDQEGGRRAMIAPLQEMNGVWTAYGRDSTPEQLIQAYRHIVEIFAQKGVTRNQVWWVFAPNAYSDPGNTERMFENYFPGDDVVDIIGFSSYNYGYCVEYPPAYWRWESFPEIFEPYIARMEAMAPTKPIIITETAASAYYHDENGNPVVDYDKMSQWLDENYKYFANRANVLGVFYFSFEVYDGFNCKVELDPNGQLLSGYVTGLTPSSYTYMSARQLDYLVHNFR